jgi:ammonia channel protein AmtB
MLHVSKTFVDQTTLQAYLLGFFYIVAAMATLLVVPALALIDAGLVSAKHLIDAFAQKLVCAMIGGMSCLIGGYALWMAQFNVAFNVPHPFRQAFSDWWLFGHYMTTYASNIDPSVLPGAEVSQVFIIFFFAYAAVMSAFIHSIGLGRMKPLVCYILCAVAGGVLMPIMVYLTWSPASPLTNRGVHDFVGAYSLYMFIGVWGIILAWRLGPRIASSNSFNVHMFASGVMLLLMAIPFFVIGCGFVQPGTGYFGVAGNTSGLAIVFCNVLLSYCGGTISGAVIAYRKHKPVYMFLGPVAGYIACSALFDIAAPWQCLLIAAVGPWLTEGVKIGLTKLNIDDQKIVPLALGTSIFSVLMAGIVGAGLPAGGVTGAVGAYAFQHAHISFGKQCIGVLVTVLISAVSGLVLVFLLEKTLGLRVAPQIEQDGLDAWYWNEWRKSRKMRVSPKSRGDYQPPHSLSELT